MALVLKNKFINIKLDTNTIIGVMGDYNKLLESLTGDNIFYLDNRISLSKKKVSIFLVDTSIIKDYELDKDFLNKQVNELSHSELKLLKYFMLINSNKKIIVIDEPFIDLDYQNKKKIIVLLKNMVKANRTIIIGSNDSNIIYSLCKKILLINDKDCYYGDINILEKKKILKKYNIHEPDIVEFVNLVKDKKIKLKYSNDIRDLIKDVYRNVSQK
jgi:ABC-type multidrug transport system ATPase subunit